MKNYKTGTDILWFDFGIKETIADLSETEQGLCLIALCSSLQLAFDVDYSAAILRELCHKASAPQQLVPAYSQWRALLSLCSGILMNSRVELVMLQHFKFTSSSLESARTEFGSPESLVEVLVELSNIQQGSVAYLDEYGQASCAWLAAFAEQTLSLSQS